MWQLIVVLVMCLGAEVRGCMRKSEDLLFENNDEYLSNLNVTVDNIAGIKTAEYTFGVELTEEMSKTITLKLRMPVSLVVIRAYLDYPATSSLTIENSNVELVDSGVDEWGIPVVKKWDWDSSLSDEININITGTFVGWTKLRLEHWSKIEMEHEELILVAVHLKETIWNLIFPMAIVVKAIMSNIGMGLKVVWPDVIAVLKKPVAPVIGFVGQFIVLPLTCWAVLTAFDMRSNIALGILAYCCSPGGTISNYHTYLMGGDISLSVTMTTISTIAAFAMMPFWMYTVGVNYLVDPDTQIQVPFKGMMLSLVLVIASFAVGILFRHFKPERAKKLFKYVVNPLMLVFMLYLYTFGIYSIRYTFRLFTPKLMLICAILPWSAMLAAGFVAFLLKRPYKDIVTIGIETGFQNGSVALMMMELTFFRPDVKTLIVGCVCVFIFQPLPVYCAELVRLVYLKFFKKKTEDDIKLGTLADEEEDRKSLDLKENEEPLFITE